jgi:hypothetical protein
MSDLVSSSGCSKYCSIMSRNLQIRDPHAVTASSRRARLGNRRVQLNIPLSMGHRGAHAVNALHPASQRPPPLPLASRATERHTNIRWNMPQLPHRPLSASVTRSSDTIRIPNWCRPWAALRHASRDASLVGSARKSRTLTLGSTTSSSDCNHRYTNKQRRARECAPDSTDVRAPPNTPSTNTPLWANLRSDGGRLALSRPAPPLTLPPKHWLACGCAYAQVSDSEVKTAISTLIKDKGCVCRGGAGHQRLLAAACGTPPLAAPGACWTTLVATAACACVCVLVRRGMGGEAAVGRMWGPRGGVLLGLAGGGSLLAPWRVVSPRSGRSPSP